MSQPLAWSFSRINKFRQCQLKSFWMDYAPKAMKVKEPPNPIFEKGKIVHKEMELAAHRNRPLTDSLKLPDGGKPMDMTPHQPVLDALTAFPTVLVEQQVAFTEDLQETSWFGKDVWCRVIWDIVAINDDNTVAICGDYKTGKPRPDSDQLDLFAASLMTKYPSLEKVKSQYYFLEHRKFTDHVVYRSAVPHIWQKFGEEAEQIVIARDTGNWEPNPGFACNYCPVPKSKCQFSQVEG